MKIKKISDLRCTGPVAFQYGKPSDDQQVAWRGQVWSNIPVITATWEAETRGSWLKVA
jgi:hypothetical protein